MQNRFKSYKSFYTVLLLLLCIPDLYSQDIINIRFEQEGKKINIYYDITGTKSRHKFDIKVYCSEDGGQTWGNPLRSVTGAVGKNQTAGYGKKITWDVLADREKLTSDVKFQVRAIITSSFEESSSSFTDKSDRNFTFHFGLSIPLSDFARSDMYDNGGGAGIGFGLGIQYTYPLTRSGGLGLYGGIDFYYNGLTKDVRNELANYAGILWDFTAPAYLNIPVTTGLNFNLKANEQVTLYGKAGFVGSFLKMTNSVWQKTGYDTYIERYDLSTTFGGSFEGGIVINNKVEIGLTYFKLGEYEIEGKYEDGSKKGNLESFNLKVDIFTLKLGFKF